MVVGFQQVVDDFAKDAPAAVLFRGLFERTFSEDRLNEIFRQHKVRQLEGDLVFASLIELLTPVVLGRIRSVRSSHQVRKETIGVSRQAVYDKLQGVECPVSEALVRCSATDLTKILRTAKVSHDDLIPDYHAFIIDGKRLDGTEHRIEETRGLSNAPLPGTVLALLDTRTRLFVDIACSTDGHACERKVVEPLLKRLQKGCLYIADRNFCDGPTLDAFEKADAYFIVRQHKRSPVWRLSKESQLRRAGKDARGGTVYEQAVEILVDGKWKLVRRITVKLATKTRGGEQEIHLFTNLPRRVSAILIANAYRGRWTIETCLGHLAQALNAEVKTLAYPKAALLCFALALVAYNIITTLSHLLAKHARSKGKKPRPRPSSAKRPSMLSPYYLSLEIVETHRGLDIATKRYAGWQRLAKMSPEEFSAWCRSIAKRANLARYEKTSRGPKKKPPIRKQLNNSTHVSTHKLLAKRQSSKKVLA